VKKKMVQDSKILDVAFNPQSIAVIGASSDDNAEKKSWVGRLLEFGYKGKIYPINLKAATVLGLKAYPSVKAVPEPIDYAIISIKSSLVPMALRDCITKGIKIAHIFAAGFAETGMEEGKKLQQEVVSIIKEGKIRIIGPNCMGIYNPVTGLTFNVRFSREAGSVGIVSQTGAGMMELIPHANARGVRFSKVVSYGNALDVNAPEFVEYFAQDNDTKYLFCYVEGVNDGYRFFTAVRDCNRTKPVIVLKGGLTEGGSGAVSSHTASLAGSELVWKAFFNQTGAIQVETLDEAVEQIVAVEKLPEIKGRRIGIVARGGGVGVVATDTCERAGLKVPALTKETRLELAKITPAEAGSSIRNPVEIGLGRFGVAEGYALGLKLVADDPNIDVVMAVINPHVYTQEGVGVKEIDQAAQVLIDSSKTLSKPLAVVVTLGDDINVIGMEMEAQQKMLKAGVPTFSTVEAAILAISKMAKYWEFRRSL
jgi:acyl-CoA synthetase (NDP forming)